MNSLFYFSDIQTVNSISVVYYVFYIAIAIFFIQPNEFCWDIGLIEANAFGVLIGKIDKFSADSVATVIFTYKQSRYPWKNLWQWVIIRFHDGRHSNNLPIHYCYEWSFPFFEFPVFKHSHRMLFYI